MSHKATNWLSDIDAGELSNSEFRVLFHLCDCHNPSRGCFPTQAWLIATTGVSNGTLNAVLKSLEEKRLIEREQQFDPDTHRKLPTHYILGFEMSDPQEPSPETGDGNSPEPSPEIGDGAISNLTPEPSPISPQSHLQIVGDRTSKEPVKNQNARARVREVSPKLSTNPAVDREARQAVERLRDGRPDALVDLKPWVLAHIIAAGLLTEQELLAAGIATG